MPVELVATDERTSARIRIDPARDEVAVKSRLAYVPDAVAFYPWLTVRDALGYSASFGRTGISTSNRNRSTSLNLDPRQKTTNPLQRAKDTARADWRRFAPNRSCSCWTNRPPPDPIVLREFYPDGDWRVSESGPEERTIFVSTHLISEFED
jgi:ABC-2 type transport system ATP-binding protein